MKISKHDKGTCKIRTIATLVPTPIMSSTPVPRTLTGLVASTYHTKMNRWNSPENWTRLPTHPTPEKFPYKGGGTGGVRLRSKNSKIISTGGRINKENVTYRDIAKKKKVRPNIRSNTPGEFCRNKIHKKVRQQKWDTYCVDARMHRYGSK